MKKFLWTVSAFTLGWLGALIIYSGFRVATGSSISATPLLYEATIADAREESPQYYLKQEAPILGKIDARAYLVADLETGDIILQSNIDKAYPIASLSKLLTAVVALDKGLPDQSLLYPLLLESDNSVANKIAATFETKQFISWMNEKAQTLGMKNAHFADPSGISPRNKASASDLFALTKTAYHEYASLIDLTRLPEKQIGEADWVSNNRFVKERADNYVGGKSGYTPEAGGTLISIFALPLSNQELRPIAIILLGTNPRKDAKYEETEKLVDYLEANVYYR